MVYVTILRGRDQAKPAGRIVAEPVGGNDRSSIRQLEEASVIMAEAADPIVEAD